VRGIHVWAPAAGGGLAVAPINGRARSTFEGGENRRAVPGRLDRQRRAFADRPHAQRKDVAAIDVELVARIKAGFD